MSEKLLVLLGGVALSAGLAGLAVVTDDPLILAVAAAVALVAIGHVMPARRLSLLVTRGQPKPPGVAATALAFTFLGISMVWAATVALDFPESSLRLAGWILVALFSVVGTMIVAVTRCAEELTPEPVDDPS